MVAKWLMLHPISLGEELEALWEKRMFIPFLGNKGVGLPVGLLLSVQAILPAFLPCPENVQHLWPVYSPVTGVALSPPGASVQHWHFYGTFTMLVICHTTPAGKDRIRPSVPALKIS